MKKMCFIFTIMLSFSVKVFCVPEISFNIPLSFNYSFPETKFSKSGLYMYPINPNDKFEKVSPFIIYNSIKGNVGVNTGFLVSAGETFVFNNNEKIKGVSVLADVGYYMLSYNMYAGTTLLNINKGGSVYDDKVKINTLFHTVNLGITLKMNVLFDELFGRANENIITSFGIGAGVKIPVAATEITKIYTKGTYSEKEVRNYSFTEVKDMFKYPLIPYIKLLCDFNIYNSSLIGMKLGWNVTYNFGIEYANMNSKTSYTDADPIYPYPENEYFKKYSFSSLEIGVAIGMTIGGFNPIKNKSASANIY